MSDSDISSLNSGVFTRTTSHTVMTGLVAQRTRNVHIRQRKQVIPPPAPSLIKHFCLSNNSGNTTQLLAFIFLPNLQKTFRHPPVSTKIHQESIYRAMKIENDDDNDELLELDNDNKSNLIYHNLKDEARFDPEVAADIEKNDNEIESKSHSEVIDETIAAGLTSRRQVRSDIYSQISVISISGCKYFKCNICPRQYKRSAGTKNIRDHFFK